LDGFVIFGNFIVGINLIVLFIKLSQRILIYSCLLFLDLVTYSLPIYTSIYWLSYTNANDNFFLFSISCLLLDFKFFLFFRVFESFGYYFMIIIVVAKKMASIVVGLFIILISFAHAFFILLKPRQTYSLDEPPPIDNNDPNNPWKLTTSYHQILENGTISSNPLFVQKTDTNTNMFTDYGGSFLSMYLFLTGIILFFFFFLNLLFLIIIN